MPFKNTIPASRFNEPYGRLTPIAVVDAKFWICLCECGNRPKIYKYHLFKGQTQSCGCLWRDTMTTHGHTHSPEYSTWRHMIQRCTNPKNGRFHHYGGRGITVCPQWISFENFLADMGNKPTPKHSLDRINNDGHYCPENCRWATYGQQNRNHSSNRNITFRGETKCITDWASHVGISRATLYNRIVRASWPIEKALTTPVNKKLSRV